MDAPRDQGDDLRVRVQWPEDETVEAVEVVRLEPPPPWLRADADVATLDALEPEPGEWAGAAALQAEPVGSPDLPPPGGLAYGVEDALGAIAARVDSLTSVTTTFHNVVSDRVSEYAEQVTKLVNSTAADLDDQRQWHERVFADLRRSTSETAEAVRRMTAMVDELTAEVAALHEETGATLAVVTDEVQGVRRRTTVRSRPSSGGLDAPQLRAVTEAVMKATRAVLELPRHVRPPRRARGTTTT